MDTIKLDSLDIPLPYIARDLCIEAVKLADRRRGNVSGSEIQTYRGKFFLAYAAHANDLLKHGMPAVGVDPFNLATFPESLIDDEPAFHQKFKKYTNSQSYFHFAQNSQLERGDLFSVSLLLMNVEMLQKLELQAMKNGMKNYKATMATLSPQIHSLHTLILLYKSIPQQAEVYADNLKKKRGARKGGAAKAGRMKELREIVVSEARELHSAATATKAAEAILQKISIRGNWLKDDKGKSLLKDPFIAFTKWIRADRSQDRQEKVSSA